MGYALGVDLGTTFTAAAVWTRSGVRVLPLGPDVVAPSVVFAAEDGRLLTGTAAEARAAQEPARVVRGFKRRLGDPTTLVLGGVSRSPEALLAAQLRDVVAIATAAEGAPPDTVVLTCPAVWGSYRREHFDEVPRLAGVPNAHIVTEPEAAAAHYTAERRLGDGQVIAVYDLGGGTFDATLLRARDAGLEILGTPEGVERLGGIDFDEALLAHVRGAVPGLDPAVVRGLCTRAKEALSVEPDVVLPVPVPGGTHPVTVTRRQFNEMIRPSVALTTDALQRTVESAGLRMSDVAAVLLAGGSSRIPLVNQVVSATFGKPVHRSLHPKFTVALGAAALAGAVLARSTAAPPRPVRSGPVSVVPVVPAAATRRTGKRKWLVPVVATAAAVAVAVAAVLALTGGDPDGITPAGSTAGTAPPDLEVFAGRGENPYRGMIGSAVDGWIGTFVGEDGTATAGTISVARDGSDGLRATWQGTAAAQVYFQRAEGTDLRPYVDGAVVIDLVVHERPVGTTAVAAHCVYPCAAELDATKVLRELPIGQPSTVKIPVACFTAAGLDVGRVNTPFLLATGGRFAATLDRVRWVAGAADDADAKGCGDLG